MTSPPSIEGVNGVGGVEALPRVEVPRVEVRSSPPASAGGSPPPPVDTLEVAGLRASASVSVRDPSEALALAAGRASLDSGRYSSTSGLRALAERLLAIIERARLGGGLGT